MPLLVREIIAWINAAIVAGQAGVDLFFVLSSYLITELLVREHARRGRIDVAAFYVRRGLRIWPLYFVFLMWASTCEASWLHNAGLPRQYLLAFACFLGNWPFATSPVMPDTAALVLWTVSIEEQFYITWPLLIRFCGPKRLGGLAAGLLVIAFVVRLLLGCWGAPDYQFHYNTFARLDGIACGALMAIWLHGGTLTLSRLARRLLFAGGLALLVAATRYLYLDRPFPGSLQLYYPATALASAILLVATLAPQGQARGITAMAPIVYLGKISYGLYVFHWACIRAVCNGAEGCDWPTKLLLSLTLTIAIASASYFALERPFLKLKERFAVVPSRAA